MSLRSLFGMGLVLFFVGEPVMAQTAPKSEKSATAPAGTSKPIIKTEEKLTAKVSEADDLAAIRKASQEFMKAFNDGNAHAVAALWTEDGDYTDGTGQVFSGREAIEKEYAAFFTAKKGLQIKIVIDSLRLLNRTAAIEDGRAVLEPASSGGAGMTKYVVVHVKAGDKWLMSTVRDSVIESPSTQRELDDMEWLIGSWVSEEYGSRTESVCRWVANKNFVERAFTVKHPDETESSGIQVIGFNPQGGHVQSWSFSSDGGFAVGIWKRQSNGWSSEVSGTTGDGTSTTAVNLLTRLDDNAYTWQSISRTAGGNSMSDTNEVVIKRSKETR